MEVKRLSSSSMLVPDDETVEDSQVELIVMRCSGTAWYKCSKCKKIKHCENFEQLSNGRKSECIECA